MLTFDWLTIITMLYSGFLISLIYDKSKQVAITEFLGWVIVYSIRKQEADYFLVPLSHLGEV